MVRQSIITLALLHEYVFEFRGNNTYIILDRTALTPACDVKLLEQISSMGVTLKSTLYFFSWLSGLNYIHLLFVSCIKKQSRFQNIAFLFVHITVVEATT